MSPSHCISIVLIHRLFRFSCQTWFTAVIYFMKSFFLNFTKSFSFSWYKSFNLIILLVSLIYNFSILFQHLLNVVLLFHHPFAAFQNFFIQHLFHNFFIQSSEVTFISLSSNKSFNLIISVSLQFVTMIIYYDVL